MCAKDLSTVYLFLCLTCNKLLIRLIAATIKLAFIKNGQYINHSVYVMGIITHILVVYGPHELKMVLKLFVIMITNITKKKKKIKNAISVESWTFQNRFKNLF